MKNHKSTFKINQKQNYDSKIKFQLVQKNLKNIFFIIERIQ